MESPAAANDAGDNHYVHPMFGMGTIATGPVSITSGSNISSNWGFHGKFRHMDGEGV